MVDEDVIECLEAGVIDQQEADAFTAWLGTIDQSVDNRVPESLFDIVEKMYLYLDPAEGSLQ